MEEGHTVAGGEQGGQGRERRVSGMLQPRAPANAGPRCIFRVFAFDCGFRACDGSQRAGSRAAVVHLRRRNLMSRTSRAPRGRWDMLVGQSLRRHRALSAMFGWLLASVKCSLLLVRVCADTWATPPPSGIRAHCTLTPSCSTSPSLCRFLRQDPPLPQPADGLCSLRRCWRRRCPLGHPSQR